MPIPRAIVWTCKTEGESREIKVTEVLPSADYHVVVDYNVPADAENDLIPVGWDQSELEDFILIADHDLSVGINATYPGGYPDIDLLANVPFIWRNNGYYTNPLNQTDPIAVYFDNGSQITRFRAYVR